MRRRTRLWIATPSALGAAIILAGAVGWFWLHTSLPPLDGEVVLAGLRERAEVIYDASGIPHIRIETQGEGFTVNRGRHSVADAEEPFASNHGSAYRAVYDLSNLSNSVSSIGTGSSGNFLSWRSDNTTRQWRNGEYMRIPQTRAEALRGAAGVPFLLPGPRSRAHRRPTVRDGRAILSSKER